MAYGARAICALLLIYQHKHGLHTIEGMINRWAPPVENNTSAYVKSVSDFTGVPKDSLFDLTVAANMCSIVEAIICQENGLNRVIVYKYLPDIQSGVNMALGITNEPA